MKHSACFLLPLLILLQASIWSHAQNAIPNDLLLVSPDSTDGGVLPGKMITSGNGGFLIAGSDKQHGYIRKVGACGNELWTRKYLLGDETGLNNLVELPSGEIVAVGSCRNCAPGDTTRKALVLKTDAAGQLLQDTALGYFNFDAEAYDVLLTANGKLAVSGHAFYAVPLFFINNTFLTVLDDAFQPDFWKEYDQFYLDFNMAATQTADGGFVLAGTSVPAFGAPQRAQLFRADAAGNQLWKYTSPHLESRFNDVVQAPDGRIVALGDRELDDLVNREVYLAVFDEASGALLDEKTYGSPDDDAGKSVENTETGFLVGAVYGTPSQSGWSSRNWVFRLDLQLNFLDEHFRDGYLFAHTLVNALPLSSDGCAFAYHSRLAFFAAHQILFFKRTCQGDRAALTQAPLHDQLVPRDLATNKGTVVFSGTLPDPAVYDEMRLDVWRNDALLQTLYDDSPQAFSFSTEIPAELANYTFRLAGRKNQQWHTEAEACDVVAGDAYLIQGQSNAVAGVPFDLDNIIDHAYRHHQTPFVRNFGLKSANDTLFTWRKEAGSVGDYADNFSGQWGLILGKNIADNYGIPVAIMNGAIGGIFIETMLPNPNNHADTSRVYGKFLRRVQHSGLIDHLRGIFMFQGESNALSQDPNSGANYFQKFETLDDAWHTDFPALERRYLFQIRPGWFNFGATLQSCLRIEEAQRQIAETLPGWQIMSSTGMNHDGLHYHYANGYERAGHDIYRLAARDLYGDMNTENIYPPTVDTLRFSNCAHTELTLELRHATDSYAWTPGWESDFWLEGDTAITVVGGAIQGNTVVLQLSAAPGAGFTGLSYRSHPAGSEAPVKNANGIGMLTFYNFPAIAYPTPQTADTLRLCSGETYTLPDGTVISQSGNYSLVLTSAVGCDSLVALRVDIFDPIALLDVLIIPDSGMGSGSITVMPEGGYPGYSFSWSTGDIGPTADSLSPGTYTVTVADALGCFEVFELQMIVGVSQPGFDLPVTLFPNPCRDYLNLLIPGHTGLGTFRVWVTDLAGKTTLPLMQVSRAFTRIETASLPPGTYACRLLKNGRLVWTGMFVKGY